MVDGCPANRRGDLDVWQMERSIENVEWAISHFDVPELNLFQGRILVHHDEGAGMRRSAQGVVDKACVEHLIRRQKMGHLPHVFTLRTVHAATPCTESGRIC
jgi:hypothetical protein